jgi:hypothetical protein
MFILITMKSPFFASKRSSFLSRRTALPVWSWYPSLGCYWVISSRSWRWSCRAYPNGLCRLEGKHCWNQPDIWDFDGIYVVRAGFLWFFCRIRVGSVCDIYKPKSRLFGDSGIYMEIVSPNPIFFGDLYMWFLSGLHAQIHMLDDGFDPWRSPGWRNGGVMGIWTNYNVLHHWVKHQPTIIDLKWWHINISHVITILWL